ncbi:MAG: DUF3617 domain-containing protein [Geminicoccales bacterium]
MHHRASACGPILGLLILLAGPALGEGLPISDGLWETTTTSPMTGAHTSRECLKDTELDPATMLQGQGDCRMTEERVVGNRLTFTMDCGAAGAAQGHMFVEGDQSGGALTMQLDVGGRETDMTVSWDAHRIGDC